MMEAPSSEPLLVEVIAYAPTAYYQCKHCEVAFRAMGASNNVHDEQIQASLPADLANDYQAVSDWIRDLFRAHCEGLLIKVIDAASLEGFAKVIRYRTRRLPAVIVGRDARFSGQAGEVLDAARREIDRRLAMQQPVSAA